MNLRFVETFVWVARLQSISRTAEKLFMTQSAISSRIAMLEKELSNELIDRRDRQFRLTKAGERFLDHAEHLLAIQHRMKRELCDQHKVPITLRLGVIETVLHTWLTPLLEWLRTQRPLIKYELNVEMTPVLHQHFQRGGLDLVFTAESASGKRTVNEKLPPLEMVFVGRRRLRRRGPLTPRNLQALEILTFQRNSQPYAALSHTLASYGLIDKPVHSLSSISALVKLVESGFGIATLPLEALKTLQEKHDLAVLESEIKLKPLPLFASYMGTPASPEIEAIIAQALAFARAAMR